MLKMSPDHLLNCQNAGLFSTKCLSSVVIIKRTPLLADLILHFHQADFKADLIKKREKSFSQFLLKCVVVILRLCIYLTSFESKFPGFPPYYTNFKFCILNMFCRVTSNVLKPSILISTNRRYHFVIVYGLNS